MKAVERWHSPCVEREVTLARWGTFGQWRDDLRQWWRESRRELRATNPSETRR